MAFSNPNDGQSAVVRECAILPATEYGIGQCPHCGERLGYREWVRGECCTTEGDTE